MYHYPAKSFNIECMVLGPLPVLVGLRPGTEWQNRIYYKKTVQRDRLFFIEVQYEDYFCTSLKMFRDGWIGWYTPVGKISIRGFCCWVLLSFSARLNFWNKPYHLQNVFIVNPELTLTQFFEKTENRNFQSVFWFSKGIMTRIVSTRSIFDISLNYLHHIDHLESWAN